MIFSPLVVVATGIYLASASPLQPRFDLTQRAAYADPHAGPSVPANHTFTAADGGVAWKEAFEKARSIVEQMTLAEKVNITSGVVGPCVGNTGEVSRFNIPSLCLEDGPLGVRPVDFVSQFPSGVATAATWDHDLFYARAKAIGEEFKGKGVHMALGPVTGGPLGRSPLGARNWEGFAPDNYLNGVASKLSVGGMQDAGVMACSKHFIAYEQDTFRTLNIPGNTNLTSRFQQIDSYLDDKTLHELYLTSFAEAVRAGTSSVMCSYNSVNGEHSCGNNGMLNGVLKSELGFQGSVVSDWGGTWDTVKDASYGLDISMPGYGFSGELGTYFNEELLDAIGSGADQVTEARLNDMAIRTLTPYFWLSQDNSSYPAVSFNSDYTSSSNQHVNVQADHFKVIRTIASEGATLLKNNRNGTYGLPIDSSIKRIGVFGQDAGPNPSGLTGCGAYFNCLYNESSTTEFPHANGTLSTGGGSGSALAPYVIDPLEAISARGRMLGMRVDYELEDSPLDVTGIQNVALGAEKCIVFVSAYQTEGFDRVDLKLGNNGDELINLVASNCSDVTVVIHSGQTVDMEAWIDNDNVTSVIFAYYPGQESGNAITSVLFGDLSPSGKLPFTIGKQIEDYPGGADSIIRTNVDTPNANFTEGLFIDYKWFDAHDIEPRFPFGFGLSYSTFSYSNASVAATPSTDSDFKQKTNEQFEGDGGLYDILYTVSATVTNNGTWNAAEVAQMYLTFPESQSDQPVRLLRGFCKEVYAPGEARVLTFPLRAKDMAVWSTDKQSWFVPSGEFTFSIGSSSRDLPITTTVTV